MSFGAGTTQTVAEIVGMSHTVVTKSFRSSGNVPIYLL